MAHSAQSSYHSPPPARYHQDSIPHPLPPPSPSTSASLVDRTNSKRTYSGTQHRSTDLVGGESDGRTASTTAVLVQSPRAQAAAVVEPPTAIIAAHCPIQASTVRQQFGKVSDHTNLALLRDHWAEYDDFVSRQERAGSSPSNARLHQARTSLANDDRVESLSSDDDDDDDDGDLDQRNGASSKKIRRTSPVPGSSRAPSTLERFAITGPCSNTWKVPPLKARRRRKDASNVPPPRHQIQCDPSQPKPRGQLLGQDREETALTRQIKACVRCRMQKNRCEPDPFFPTERACLRCQRLSEPALSVLPCLRYIITDASLYREQSAPTQQFSKRWQTMDIVNIKDWADDEIRVIEISHLFMYAPYKAKMRRFVPVEGDMIEEFWTDRHGNIRRHDIPPYAIADMEEHIEVVREFIDRTVGEYIVGLVDKLDPLLWNTYMQAFRHMANAREDRERKLMANAFRFWASCRCTSHEGRLVGTETLGVQIVSDPCSPYYTHIPPPPMLGAQEECIFYTKLLRPLSKNILDELQSMMLSNKRKHWLTIYLTTFILLHSCSMITRRDAETAAKWSLPTHYANPKSIEAHHMGALTLLAHFHYINKGKKPFVMALDPIGLRDVAKSAELLPDEVDFVQDSAKLIYRRDALMRQVREQKAFGHDLYWVSQLYEQDWEPSATYVV